ncbi:MAG TPA: nitrate- and nitrite sensing domain-containing protein [Polyangia bacterium]|nr:nitrate- and nitrite sensing domain-containing protein [Polyangia bacterium]
MPLSSTDAARVLRFCLVADDAGTVEERDDGSCVVTIVTSRPTYQVHTFEELTFDAALRSAAGRGVLRAACVEKQIAFTTRCDPLADATAARRASSAPPPAAGAAPAGSGAPPATFLALTDNIGSLLHETQRERGISTLFVGSGGQLAGDELAEQWKRSDQRRAALFDGVAREMPSLPSSVGRRYQHAGSLLGAVDGTRDAVMGGRIEAPRVIEVYSALNAALLAAVEAMMVAGVPGPARNHALACVVLQHAKEKAGIERAQLAMAFLRDRFTQGERLSVASLIAAQATYLHIFAATAPEAGEAALRLALASPAAAEVQRMESVVFLDGESGFGIDPSLWFRAITRKIDLLGEVSNATLASLAARE